MVSPRINALNVNKFLGLWWLKTASEWLMDLRKEEEEISWVVIRLLEERLWMMIWAWIWWSWRIVLEP